MNELDDAELSLGSSLHGDVILLCDPSDEGEMIGAALRSIGFSVPTAKLPIIEVRMLEEEPRICVLDIDQPDAVETIERMRELPDGAALMLVCVGDSKRADLLRAGYAQCFPRPVDITELVAYIKANADPNPRARKTQESIAPPPRSLRGHDTVPPPTRDSEAPDASAPSSSPDAFDLASILPSSLGALSSGAAMSTQLSPELEQLMLSAEERIGPHPHVSSMPPPDEDELLLAPELLLALDEPFDVDDEAGGTGPEPSTRSLSLGRRGQRVHTHDGSTGVRSPFEQTGDSLQGTPVETDPMAASKSVRGFAPPPASAGSPSPSKRGRAIEEDTAHEAPVSRRGLTPSERRSVVSTRTFDPQRLQQPPPHSHYSHYAQHGSQPSQRSQRSPYAQPSQNSPQPSQNAPQPSQISPQPSQISPQLTVPSHQVQTDASSATQAKSARSSFPTSQSPLSVYPGSTYSTRSAGSRGAAAETVRPASAMGAMTEPMRRPPMTAASPAPMPPSVYPSAPSRRPPPFAPAAVSASIPRPPRAPAVPPPAPPAPPPPPAPKRPSVPERRSVAPPPEPTRAAPPEIAPVLGDGDAALVLAQVIAARATGSLVLKGDMEPRRIVLQDGDIMTAASWVEDETLLAFLVARGDIDRELAARFEGKLPPFGRHAGAALIAHGHLGQDDLWPVLRAHAEWIIGRALLTHSGTCELEPDAPGRLKAEPNVFGGATGAEVFIETVRRVVPHDTAVRRTGGLGARVNAGPHSPLLGECALRRDEEDLVRSAQGRSVSELIESTEPEFVTVIYALACLGVVEIYAAPAAPKSSPAPQSFDPLDAEAVRQRVKARLALVEDGDYFSLLGVARTATNYELRRAYLELRRAFEPARLLTAATADLSDDVRIVVEVLDEAYDILRDPRRRERYRKAIESPGPQ